MALVPSKKSDRIGFFETHIPTWMTNATAIGSTTADVTNVQTKTEAARTAYAAQLVAQAAAKTAVQACDEAVEAMLNAGMVVIEQVRTKARTAGDGVYTLADLPAPATPESVGAPGTPYQFKSSLKPNGTVEITFKCDNPVGCNNVIYQVYRRSDETGEFQYLGGAGQRRFVDTTLPAGSSKAVYQIQGTRSTAVGDAAEFTVNFGVGATVPSTAFLGTATPKGTPAKIAA